jgi:hypothetical protein
VSSSGGDTPARPGFFIPYRYRDTVQDRRPYTAMEHILDARRQAFGEVLAACDRHAEALRAIPASPTVPGAPRWMQDWFPTLDAAVAYTMVRERAPARIVEVGSGHSTRFLARAIADGGLATVLTAIDPAPRAALTGLDVRWIETMVQEAGTAPFEALAPGDLVSIDSSHILMPGTDVDMLLNEVLPGLPAGVLVHIHDIMLPDPYPEAWAWRGYNEQQAVGPLVSGGGYEVLFASHYAATRMAHAVGASAVGSLPAVAEAPAGSLWLEKACEPGA